MARSPAQDTRAAEHTKAVPQVAIALADSFKDRKSPDLLRPTSLRVPNAGRPLWISTDRADVTEDLVAVDEIARDLPDLAIRRFVAFVVLALHIFSTTGHSTVEQRRDREGAQIRLPPGWTRSRELRRGKIPGCAKCERTTDDLDVTDSVSCSDPHECCQRAMMDENARPLVGRVVSRQRRSMRAMAVKDMDVLGGPRQCRA